MHYLVLSMGLEGAVTHMEQFRPPIPHYEKHLEVETALLNRVAAICGSVCLEKVLLITDF